MRVWLGTLGIVCALCVSACSSSSNHTGATATSSSTATTSTAQATTTSRSTTTANPTAQFANGKNAGYIHSVDTQHRTLTVDIIQYFTGDAANAAAKQDGQPTPVPNDYYIRNVNPAVYTFPIGQAATFTILSSEPASPDNPEPKTTDFQTFATVVNGHAAKGQTDFNPWWITTSNGSVVSVEEIFRP